MQVFDDRFNAESTWNCECMETVNKNLHETYQCRTYCRKLLMMGREVSRNMTIHLDN
jgi:late competence protein required for DNA uptake (superfamily II DNA/RNA helicase)